MLIKLAHHTSDNSLTFLIYIIKIIIALTIPPPFNFPEHFFEEVVAAVGDDVARQAGDAKHRLDEGLRNVVGHGPLGGEQPRQAAAAVETLDNVFELAVGVLRHVNHRYLTTILLFKRKLPS